MRNIILTLVVTFFIMLTGCATYIGTDNTKSRVFSLGMSEADIIETIERAVGNVDKAESE
ncbi:MAG: hypothetical protein ABH872_00375 [Candidatus Omnitrophota bacterium]